MFLALSYRFTVDLLHKYAPLPLRQAPFDRLRTQQGNAQPLSQNGRGEPEGEKGRALGLQERDEGVRIDARGLVYKSLSLSILSTGIVLTMLTTPSYALPADFGLRAPAQVEKLLQTPVQKPQVKADNPSDKSLTVPGLWWANQQFGDKMVQNWFAYRRPEARSSQVRAIVRPDLWSRYTYLERYAFLRRFGATSSAAGYHLLVLDRQNYLLGSYTCEFPSQTKPAPLNPWEQRLVPLTLPPIKAPCNVWISPVYGSEFF